MGKETITFRCKTTGEDVSVLIDDDAAYETLGCPNNPDCRVNVAKRRFRDGYQVNVTCKAQSQNASSDNVRD